MNEIETKFMEKTTDICKLLEKMICTFKGEVDSNVANLDTDEAYKVADIIKDLSETYKNISKALYYGTVSSAMEDYEGESEEDEGMRYYTPMRDSRGRYMRRRYHDMGMNSHVMYDDPRYYDENRDLDRGRGRMYYTEHDMGYKQHDMRDGHNWNSRRTYMENPSKENLEKHIEDISTDIKELMVNMTPDNKVMVKNKLISLANAM